MACVTVRPDGKTLSAPDGESLLETLAAGGVALTSPCGGEGTCGKCRVRVEGSANPPTVAERTLLGDLLDEGLRLACQTLPAGDLDVEVPDTSRLPNVRVLAGGVGREVPFFANVRRRTFHWERRNLDATGSEFDAVARLLNARADLRADLPLLRELADALEPGRTLHATILGDRLIELIAEPEPPPPIGIALDIGTTTIVTNAVRLDTGETIGTASALNDQSQYGSDVIARINHAVGETKGLEELQKAARETVIRCVEAALSKSDASLEEVYEMTVVGNTTMLHLFAGVSPRSLASLPFAPVWGAGLDVPTSALDLPFHPRGNVHLLPSIAGYIGADTIGAMLAAGFDEPFDGIRVLADIGTNCELVLQRGDEVIACSTPAGPAFEGARMDFGMLAGPGAIESVSFGEDVEVRVIGRAEPKGICGSGVLDIGAALLRSGVVDPMGRLLGADEVPDSTPTPLRERIRTLERGNAFEIARNEAGEPILFTQKDVRELQLAKAAVRTGIDMLLDRAGVDVAELDTLLIAGGFGNYINKENARYLGMIPEIPDEKIRYIGNAALVGSRLALISQEMRTRAERMAREVRHLQLAGTPDFQMRFTEAMLFGDEFRI